MFCPQCGRELSNEAKFCPDCGQELSRSAKGSGTRPHSSAPAADSDLELSNNASVPAAETSGASATTPISAPTTAASTTPEPAKDSPARKAGAAPSSRMGATSSSRAGTASSTSAAATSAKSKLPMLVAAAVLVVVAFMFLGNMCSSNPAGNEGEGEGSAVQQEWKPANFAEWISAYNPDYLNTLRNDILRAIAVLNVQDVQVGVQGNQLNIILINSASSADVGFVNSIINTFLNDGLDYVLGGQAFQSYSDLAASLEYDSGFPVVVHVEERYSDGALVNSYDFSSGGRIN